MNKKYNGELHGDITDEALEGFYQAFILPEFGLTGDIHWERHVRTDPDNFLHIFSVKNIRYALAFDDYPGDFSVGRDDSVKAMRLPDGEKLLHVNTYGKYIENVTGGFMLFQVLDDTELDALVEYLDVRYRNETGEMKNVVVVTRDLLALAEVASQNHDCDALISLLHIIDAFLSLNIRDKNTDLYLLRDYIDILADAEYGYEYYSVEEQEMAAERLYRSLSTGLQRAVTIRKYEANRLGKMIKLVSAMYAKDEGGTTSGISISFTCEDAKILYPNEHFVNDDLKKYFAEHAITGINVEHHLPETLSGYKLVAGSQYVRYVFRRELDYVGF